MTYKVVVEGLDDFKSDLLKGKDDLQPAVNEAMVKSVNLVKNTAQELVKYDTGTLRRSIYTDVQLGGFRGIVGQDIHQASYGPVIEFGSKPHVIVAKNKKVLANRKLGLIFGKTVHHPGTKAYPFMVPAMERNLEKIKDFFSEAMLRVVQVMAGK